MMKLWSVWHPVVLILIVRELSVCLGDEDEGLLLVFLINVLTVEGVGELKYDLMFEAPPGLLVQNGTNMTDLFDDTNFEVLAEQYISTEENDFVEGLVAPSVAINDFLKTACDDYDITGAQGLLPQVTHLRPDLTDVTCSVKETDDRHMKYGCKGKDLSSDVTYRFSRKGSNFYQVSIVHEANHEVNHRAQLFRISDYGKCGAAVLACVASEHAVSYGRGPEGVRKTRHFTTVVADREIVRKRFTTDKYGDDGAKKLVKVARASYRHRSSLKGKLRTEQHLSQGYEEFVDDRIAPSVAPNRSLQNERDGTELFDDTNFEVLAEQYISTEENDFVEGLVAPSVAINDFLKTACTDYDITGAQGLLAQVTHLRPDLTDVTCSVKETDDGHMKYGCGGNNRYYEVTRCTDTKCNDVYESSMVWEVNHRAQSFGISDYGECGAAVLACVASEHAVSYGGRAEGVRKTRRFTAGAVRKEFATDKYGDDGAKKLVKVARASHRHHHPLKRKLQCM
eukprot:Lankesteria_metandrocarpae@DN5472_c2_g1_i2.p1